MIAEALNAFCEAIERLDRIDGVKEVCAEFSIRGLAFEHVIDGDGHGMRILEAILAGERNPEALARFCNTRIRVSRQTVAKSLHGNWREQLPVYFPRR